LIIVNGQTREMRASTQAIHERMGPALFDEAARDGLTLSAWLEQEDPSQEGDANDAYGRQLWAAGLKVRSVGGVYADRLEKFGETPANRALLAEYLSRRWRAASAPDLHLRNLHTIADATPGSIMRPYVDSAVDHSKRIAPAIPLASLIATTTPIDGDAYRAFYLTDSPSAQRFVRVGEAAEVPRTKLSQGERTVNLYKFGRALEMSYEAMRRQRIDRVGLTIARMAVQAEVDKVAAVIDVIVNGDGNANTAATNTNIKTDLDSAATSKSVTLKGWLLWKMLFANPYMLTTAIAQSGDAYKLLSLNTGSGNVPLVTIAQSSGFGGFQQINQGLADNVALGWRTDAPTDKIVGIDRRFAIERVTEAGASLTEVARWVEKQTQILVMTEVEGYAVMDPAATRTLTLET